MNARGNRRQEGCGADRTHAGRVAPMSQLGRPCLEREHRQHPTHREDRCSLWHFRQAATTHRSDFLVQTYRASSSRSMVQSWECLEDGLDKWRNCFCRFLFSEREARISRFHQGQWGEDPASTGRIQDCNLPARHNEIGPCVPRGVLTSDMTPVQRPPHDTQFEGCAPPHVFAPPSSCQGEACRHGRQSTPQPA